MEKQPSFINNVLKGISIRMKKIFSGPKNGFRLGSVYSKYLKHLPGNKIHTGKLLGHSVSFGGGPEYLHALNEIFVENIYNQKLNENAYVIDCGAHIGISVIFIKHICPTAEIVCFEPDKKNFKLLSENINSFGFQKVKAENKAVWISNSMISFSMEGNMSSRISSGGTTSDQVEACRLYDFLDRKIDFLKIDIEGAEYEVIKDIEPRLSNVLNLFIEYHGTYNQNNELVEIFNILQRNNFRFYIKEAAPVYREPFTQHRDFGIYDLQLNIFCIKNNS